MLLSTRACFVSTLKPPFSPSTHYLLSWRHTAHHAATSLALRWKGQTHSLGSSCCRFNIRLNSQKWVDWLIDHLRLSPFPLLRATLGTAPQRGLVGRRDNSFHPQSTLSSLPSFSLLLYFRPGLKQVRYGGRFAIPLVMKDAEGGCCSWTTPPPFYSVPTNPPGQRPPHLLVTVTGVLRFEDLESTCSS
jgi:hypothetical protein